RGPATGTARRGPALRTPGRGAASGATRRGPALRTLRRGRLAAGPPAGIRIRYRTTAGTTGVPAGSGGGPARAGAPGLHAARRRGCGADRVRPGRDVDGRGPASPGTAPGGDTRPAGGP